MAGSGVKLRPRGLTVAPGPAAGGPPDPGDSTSGSFGVLDSSGRLNGLDGWGRTANIFGYFGLPIKFFSTHRTQPWVVSSLTADDS